MFAELDKFKGAPQNIATRVDGHTEPESIADHLKGIYETLYNRTGTDEPLKNLLGEVDGMITAADLNQVDKITPELIRIIIKDKIRPGKNDPEFDLTTDNLRNAP